MSFISLGVSALGLNGLASGAAGAITKGATAALGNTIGPALGGAATKLIGLPAAGAAPAVANTAGPLSKMTSTAMGHFQPVINDVTSTFNDFKNPSSLSTKVMDIANTTLDAKKLKGEGVSSILQPQNPAMQQMPTLDPDKHLNAPDDNGIRTFNDEGTQMLNDHITPQRFNGYPAVGQAGSN